MVLLLNFRRLNCWDDTWDSDEFFFPRNGPRSAGGIQDSTSSQYGKGILICGFLEKSAHILHLTLDKGPRISFDPGWKNTSHPCPALILKELWISTSPPNGLKSFHHHNQLELRLFCSFGYSPFVFRELPSLEPLCYESKTQKLRQKHHPHPDPTARSKGCCSNCLRSSSSHSRCFFSVEIAVMLSLIWSCRKKAGFCLSCNWEAEILMFYLSSLNHASHTTLAWNFESYHHKIQSSSTTLNMFLLQLWSKRIQVSQKIPKITVPLIPGTVGHSKVAHQTQGRHHRQSHDAHCHESHGHTAMNGVASAQHDLSFVF